jgi:hypothetical protein
MGGAHHLQQVGDFPAVVVPVREQPPPHRLVQLGQPALHTEHAGHGHCMPLELLLQGGAVLP